MRTPDPLQRGERLPSVELYVLAVPAAGGGGGRMAEMAEEPPIVPKPIAAALPRVLPGALAALAPSGGV